MGNHFRWKNNDVLLLKDKAAAALATAESNLAKERKISDDLKEKLLALDEMAERRWRQERKKVDVLNEKLAALDAAAELEAAAARAAAASVAARAAAAATRAAAKITEEQQKNSDLKSKLLASELANARVVVLSSSRAAKIQRLETEAAETAETLSEATRIAGIYKNTWSFWAWPPPPGSV